MKSVLLLLILVIGHAQVQQIATLPVHPQALAVDSGGNMYMAGATWLISDPTSLPALNRYRNRAVVFSADGGATWAPIGDLPHAGSVAVAADPWTPGVLLIDMADGVWKTTDSGVHWRNTGLTDSGLVYDPAIPGHVLSDQYYSIDGGETWKPQSKAETQFGPYAFDPRGNGTVLQTGTDGRSGNVAVSRDGGRTWSVRGVPEKGYSPHEFVFDLLQPGVVYGCGSGYLFRSVDNGESFVMKAVPFYADHLSVDTAHPGWLYGVEFKNIWRSDDMGEHWEKFSSTLADFGLWRPILRGCGSLIGGGSFASLRSTDDGITWTAIPVIAPTLGAGCTFYGVVIPQSVYLFKRSPDGQRLLWGAFLDGANPVTDLSTIGVDLAGNVAIAGMSSLKHFSPYSSEALTADAWVAKLDPAGNLIYSTTFGGDQDDKAKFVTLDQFGNTYVAGVTSSRNFPVTPEAAQSTFAGGSTDAFVAVLNSAGDLTYATFLGGSFDEVVSGITLDSAGRTSVGGYSQASANRSTGFLARLERRGAKFEFSSNVGEAELVDLVALGRDDSIYLTGRTMSTYFPVTRPPFGNSLNAAPNPPDPCLIPDRDRFLLRLDAERLQPIYSSLFGVHCAGDASGLEIRPDGAAILQMSGSDAFPHRAPLSMASGWFWTEVSPDASSLRYSGPLGLLPAALAPDGTLLSIDGASLQRVSIPTAPEMAIDHVANAFSGIGAGIVPGGLYSISSVDDIGPSAEVWLGLDAANPPTELDGVRVLFGTAPAQILYASAHRVICIAPHGSYSTVHVEFAGRESNYVAISQPSHDAGLLSGHLLPAGGLQLFAENPDGSANNPENPVARGSAVVLYVTGVAGPISGVFVDGRLVPSPPIRIDGRFAAQVYRAEVTIPPASNPGPVLVKLAYIIYPPPHPHMPISPYYSDFGNSVIVYVK